MTDYALVLHPDIQKSGQQSGSEPALRAPEARLEEAAGLAAAIGLDVVESEVVAVKRVRPATLIGGGAVERFVEEIRARDIAVVVVDSALSPVQQRNLEKAWNCKVIDRTGLILEIFGARARTKEGKLQVELAALSYQRSRLVRSWTHLERQRGGAGFMGGPGERQLEIDRRLITERITRLKKELTQVQRTRGLHRGARQRVPYPVVTFVGYTNAGKSTLFNRLTEAKVLARDQLFATLDPTMRRVVLPSGQVVILSDTVGFISDLPTDLVAAFRATLEEVLAADLILHVRDAAHPDSRAQKADVEAVLADLGVTEAADHLLEVLNKCDLLGPDERTRLSLRDADQPKAVLCSALTGEGCAEILEMIDRALSAKRVEVDLQLPLSAGAALSWLYDRAEVVERQDEGMDCYLALRIAPSDLRRYLKKFPESAEINKKLAETYGQTQAVREKDLQSG